MKVLIVDDSSDKIRKILNVLIDSGLDEDRDIDVAYCARDAALLLESNDYGLMIIDLYLPIRLSEQPKMDGGAFLLKEIERRESLHRPEHILGLTAHDDAKKEAEPEFNKGLWTIAKISSSSNEWKEVIVEKVRYLIARNASQSQDAAPACDVLFVCALRNPELTQLKLALSSEWEEIALPNDATVYFRSVIEKANGDKFSVIACSSPSMGMTASATLATKASLKFRPKVLAMTGMCAGREKEIELGECLVASKTWDYGSGKFFGQAGNGNARFLASPYQLAVDPVVQTATELVMADRKLLDEIHDRFVGNSPDRRLALKFAPMASGAAVQADSQFFKSIVEHQDRKVVGIDMEAFGICWAARETFEPRPIFLVCKGVSDFANEEKADSIQEYCSFTSACIALEIIKRLPLS
ncbi:phosphorylase family protein [Chromohalobacter israelensis]|uniref:phosphorylase family protein n=1 Tax=Chromohalobacter israelensis TaxID=141390 RepID=UPI0015C42F10|nr:hypothetical protein [Chromohalobacter salexigens]NWO56034.1 hypothetical protein [Chromohalobacter salexigens]